MDFKNATHVPKPESMRDHVLQTVKKFKSSWIEMGRLLYAVWKDKMFREWGYQKFDTYVSKEIHIRKATALKLLRSYHFLEREEPSYLKKKREDESPSGNVPGYETVDVLRRAKAKKIPQQDYDRIRQKVFQEGREAHDLKKDLTQLIKQREELDPQEVWLKKKETLLKRFLSTLKSLQREANDSKLLKASTSKSISDIIKKIEDEF